MGRAFVSWIHINLFQNGFNKLEHYIMTKIECNTIEMNLLAR